MHFGSALAAFEQHIPGITLSGWVDVASVSSFGRFSGSKSACLVSVTWILPTFTSKHDFK